MPEQDAANASPDLAAVVGHYLQHAHAMGFEARSRAGVDALRALLRQTPAAPETGSFDPNTAEWVQPSPAPARAVARAIHALYLHRQALPPEHHPLSMECDLRPEDPPWPTVYDLAWAVHARPRPGLEAPVVVSTLHSALYLSPSPPSTLPNDAIVLRATIHPLHDACCVVVTRWQAGLARAYGALARATPLQDDWRALPTLMISHPGLSRPPATSLPHDALRLVLHILMRGSPPPPLPN